MPRANQPNSSSIAGQKLARGEKKGKKNRANIAVDSSPLTLKFHAATIDFFSKGRIEPDQQDSLDEPKTNTFVRRKKLFLIQKPTFLRSIDSLTHPFTASAITNDLLYLDYVVYRSLEHLRR